MLTFVVEHVLLLTVEILDGEAILGELAVCRHPLLDRRERDLEQFRIDYVADRVNTIGAVFLGLTVGCARCHDHKYDPISQREYFQLFAFLNNADEPTLDLAGPEEIARRDAIRPQLRLLENELQDYAAKWVKNLSDDRRRQVRPEIFTILALSPDQRDALHAEAFVAAQMKKREPKFPSTLVLEERAEPRETYIHLGGDFTRKGSRVSPGVPGVLHPLSSKTPLNRLDLARWLVDPKNPLLARVTVNRMWQHYFGKGLVETENDFGTQGTPPTHPELLDWLATEFVARGWSQKAIHRLIVTSAAYRQSSRHRPDLEERDPYNRLLARQSRVRLDAEIVRDSGLTAGGLLSRKIGGPSVFPPQPEGVFGFTQIPRVWTGSQGPDRYRRGMYTYFWRSAAHPLLMAFDAPDAVTACTRRNRSTTPMQALTLLNDQAFLEMAQGLAARVLAKKPDGDEARIGFAFRLCLAREPSAGEAERLLRFLRLQSEEFRAAPEEARALVPAGIATGPGASHFAAWTAVARVLLNLDEFITRE